MSNITASELIGELRRMGRQYEVFKRAEELVAVLVDQEKFEKDLQKKIKDATIVLEGVEKQIADTEQKYWKLLEDLKKRVAVVEQEIVDKKAQASDVLSKARLDAQAFVQSAKDAVQLMQKEVLDVKQAKAFAEQEAEEAQANMQRIKSMLADQKKLFSSLVG